MVIVFLRLLQLPRCNFVEAHTAQVVFVNLGDHVRLFDELVALLTVNLAFCGVRFRLHQLKLVASKNIHCADSFLFVLKEVAFQYTTFKTFLTKSLTEQQRKILGLPASVVHQLTTILVKNRVFINKRNLRRFQANTRWLLFLGTRS